MLEALDKLLLDCPSDTPLEISVPKTDDVDGFGWISSDSCWDMYPDKHVPGTFWLSKEVHDRLDDFPGTLY